MSIRVIFCATLLAFASVASAQSPAQQQKNPAAHPAVPQLTPQQRAAIRRQNQVLAKYAVEIVRLIDAGRAGVVWDASSPVAKHAITRTNFIKAIAATRTKLGQVTSRQITYINRRISKGKNLPAGLYISVHFNTKFSKDPNLAHELVSFHLDQDRRWRLAGYTVQ